MFVSLLPSDLFFSSQRVQLSGEEKKRYPSTETEINRNCTQLSVILGFFSGIFFFLDKVQTHVHFGMFTSVQQQNNSRNIQLGQVKVSARSRITFKTQSDLRRIQHREVRWLKTVGFFRDEFTSTCSPFLYP